VFGWLIAGWLAGLFTHEITVHVLPEQYFPLTTISRNSIFQSCRTGPKAFLGLKVISDIVINIDSYTITQNESFNPSYPFG